MKKIITTIVFILILSHAHSVNRYISSSTGNDSNPGTYASPWATLSKINSVSANDAVFLKRGDSWNETLTISVDSILISSYGVGAAPKIYGSGVITGWTLYSGNIYKATPDSAITQLFVNDQRMTNARYPNSGWFSITSVVNSTQFISTDLNAGYDYSGATVHIHTNDWRLDNKLITSSSGQTINIESATSYGLSTGQEFIMVNDLEFLDKPGEWYYDTTTNTVYLWTVNSDTPANYTVRGSSLAKGITATSKNNFTIRNIQILQQKEIGVEMSSCNNVTIDNCIIRNQELQGIQFSGDSLNFRNNTVQGSNYIAVSISSAGGTISDNLVTDIAIFKNLGIKGMNGFSYAASFSGTGIIIEYNTLDNCGFMGIVWTAQNAVIKYNYITRITQILPDGGGIYSFSLYFDDKVAGSYIHHNILENFNCVGALYWDERTTGVLAENNIVAHINGIGLFYHYTKDCVSRYNVIFDCDRGMRASKQYGQDTGNVFSHNTVLAVDTTSDGGYSPVLASVRLDSIAIVDTVDYNKYIDHHRTTNFRNPMPPSYPYYTFTSWKSNLGLDLNSTIDNTALGAGEIENIFYNRSKKTKTLQLTNATGITDIDGNSVTTNQTLKKYEGVILIGTQTELDKITLK